MASSPFPLEHSLLLRQQPWADTPVTQAQHLCQGPAATGQTDRRWLGAHGGLGGCKEKNKVLQLL